MQSSSIRTRGFTLIELIVILVGIAIMAASAAPLFVHGAEQKLGRASHELATHVKLARDLAVATHRRTWVDFDVANEWYGVYIESPTTPGRGSRVWVVHPVTGESQFRVDLDEGEVAGVAIGAAAFGSRTEVEFDRLGRPYNGLGTPLAADGIVVLAAGARTRTVRVVAETGLVKED